MIPRAARHIALLALGLVGAEAARSKGLSAAYFQALKAESASAIRTFERFFDTLRGRWGIADNYIELQDSTGLPQLKVQRARLSSATDGHLAARGHGRADGGIRALQWNPHWQCFADSPALCSPNAQQALTAQLRSGLDFANVVELEPEPAYTPPSGWSALTRRCGYDVTALLYNSGAWSPLGSSHPGCMQGNDRSFVVQSFTSKSSGMKVVVVGAHFPHGNDWGVLAGAIGAATSAAGTQNVLFMGDTNTGLSNSGVFSQLGVLRPDSYHGTTLLPTCCNTVSPGFVFPFDRVIANFGSNMSTEELFDPLPYWADQGGNEFHKAVVGSFSFAETST